MDKTFDDDEFLWSQFIRPGEMLGDGGVVTLGWEKNIKGSLDNWD